MREDAKLLVRSWLQGLNIEVGRDTYASRLTRACSFASVQTVIDVGANEGQFAVLLRRAGFDGRIVSFEPVTSAYGKLIARSKSDDRWEVHQVAAGAESGQGIINVSGNSYSSSLLRVTRKHVDAAPSSRPIGTESIRVRRLDEFLPTLAVDPDFALLKVDTQGFESSVLDGVDGYLGRFPLVQLEMSYAELYEGQVLQSELDQRLCSRGYRMFNIQAGISDRITGELLQADVLYALESIWNKP